MENIIIAIAAVILVAIQGHRNYLMVQAAKNVAAGTLEVRESEPIPVQVTLVLPEEYWPTVTVSNDITIDYDKLAAAFNKQEPTIINVQPTVIPTPPQYPVPPYYNPIISEGQATTGNEIEIDGVKGKKFPAR